MKKDEVPQDNANILEGKLRVLKYAVDNNGEYTKVPSSGWEPENIVLSQAWEDINEKVDAVKKRVLADELSPIAFYMEKQMMDIKMLSGYVGFWPFKIRRHLKPKHFKKLSQYKLKKYANAFQISIEQLIKLD